MKPFTYTRADTADSALVEMSRTPAAAFLAGGTNLVDLMKQRVEQPTALIDVSRIGELSSITADADGLRIGALVRNSDLANHPHIRRDYPLLSHAVLSGASAQLRNRATTGGNLMQRTRCYYFYDPALGGCNKRDPGSGCAALRGFHRIHAVLGQTDEGYASPQTCIATNPSDMNVALAALNASVEVRGSGGERSIPAREFHRLPGSTPAIDTVLESGELITAVRLPALSARYANHSYYLKVRDRQSYAFALVAVAAGLELDGDTIRSVAFAMGGVAHKPWTSPEAEAALIGNPATENTFATAADIALRGAVGYPGNHFKIELARRSIVLAFQRAARSHPA